MEFKIILAFPGAGKTTLALADGSYSDVDYGYFRLASGGNESLARQRTVDIASRELRRGQKVVLNDPQCLTLLMKKVGTGHSKPLVVAPRLDAKEEWVEKVKRRDPDSPFWSELERNWEEWIPDWTTKLLKYAEEAGYEVELTQIDSNTYLSDILRAQDSVMESEAGKEEIIESEGKEDGNNQGKESERVSE